MLVRLPNGFAIAIKENIVTALNTEGDNPVIKAKDHKTIKLMAAITHLLHDKFLNGLNNNITIPYRMPTCNPETASTCMAPLEAYAL